METTDHSVERAQQALSSSTPIAHAGPSVSVPNQRPGEAAITIDNSHRSLARAGRTVESAASLTEATPGEVFAT
jgi:hypothetical protein